MNNTTHNIFIHNGMTFVDNLYWPSSHNGKFTDIEKLQNFAGLNYNVLFKHDSGTKFCGLIKNTEDLKINHKTYSIGAVLINLYEDEFTDLIIIGKLSENQAAIIAIKEGQIVPHSYELIDSSENIRLKIIELIETFAIGNLWSIGFGNYLYNDNEILIKLKNTNPRFNPPTDETINSIVNIWQHPRINKAIRKAQIKKVAHKYINKYSILAILVGVGLVAGNSHILDAIYELTLPQDARQSANTQIVPIKPKATIITPINFVKSCLQNANIYFGRLDAWKLKKFSCDLNSQVANFGLLNSTTNPQAQLQNPYSSDIMNQSAQLIQLINLQIGKQNQQNEQESNSAITSSILMTQEKSKNLITEPDVTYNQTETLITKHLKFERADKPNYTQEEITKILNNLNKLNSIDGIKFTLQSGQNKQINLKTINFNNTKFQITSNLSPIWLINNGYLTNNISITAINAKFDDNTGFYVWNISGELPQ